MRNKLILLATLLSVLTSLLGFTGTFAQTGDGAGELAVEYASLLEKAAQQGSLRVILTVNAGFEPEGILAETAAVDRQRAGIAQAQQALLEQINAFLLERPYRFETVPLLVAMLTAEGLRVALDSGLVSAVQEDLPDAPTLAESTALIGAISAWAGGFTGAGQTIAVLDTGVDKTHPFLSGKVISEACYSTFDSRFGSSSVCPGGVTESIQPGSGVPCNAGIEGCDHGTHVAGIAAGKGVAFSGVAKDARLIAVQVFSRFDSELYCGTSVPCALTWTSDQIKGLERVYALRNSFSIAAVNMSLGGGQAFGNCDSDARKPIIDNLKTVGIATVIASGNNGFTNALSEPACISSAISVGSTGDGSSGAAADVVSDFSNSASFLTLLAPGQWINSSVPGGGFANFGGTSMAAPHVAGAWAVMKGKNPWASLEIIRNALVNTGLPVFDARNGITRPRIRLVQALAALPPTPILSRKVFVPIIKK